MISAVFTIPHCCKWCFSLLMRYKSQLKADPVTRKYASQKYSNTLLFMCTFSFKNAKHRCICEVYMNKPSPQTKKNPVINAGMKTYINID